MSTKRKHIYKRKDGRWEGRYRIGTNTTGKAVYHSIYGKNYNDIKKRLSLCEKTTETVYPARKNQLSFKDAVSLWQKTNKHRLKGATTVKYDNLIEKHIVPELGSYKLVEINTFLLTDFMNNKLNSGRIDRKGGLAPSYVRSMMLIVFDVMDFAATQELCLPLKTKIRKPSVEKKEISVLEISAQTRLENNLIKNPNETNVGILISLNAGLRISEVCALRWEDIDFKEKILHVRSTVARVKNPEYGAATKLIIDRPKTKSSFRDIPISKRLMEVLNTLYANRKSDYVVSDKYGFLSPRTYEYRFHKVLNETQIPDINYHALRHTFATRCIEFGVDVKTLSEILGHSNVSITLDTYVHPSMERKREQLEKLSLVFK